MKRIIVDAVFTVFGIISNIVGTRRYHFVEFIGMMPGGGSLWLVKKQLLIQGKLQEF